jgi:uncharacterized protein YdiU (UPF0061 family)
MTPQTKTNPLETLRFDNRFVRELPEDKESKNFRRQVSNACYSRVAPTPVSAPQLAAFSKEAAQLIGLDAKACRSEAFARVFTGNKLVQGMEPFAMRYGGHQFGNWAGQLGDGRAINLGEVMSQAGERWVLQLKGAGPTPYSRTADGLAVLRSSVREFLCSEAMYHLGIPTTRALSLTLTGEPVERDMFYDGHPKEEPGAVVCRISPSFIRFGNFQILAAQEENDLLKKLMDYTIETDFPHIDPESPDRYLTWFREICDKTIDMVVHWMRVGFVHGVMNTDNMSVLGLTIDYGPYGWLEDYTPDWTPNTTDAAGRRYSYKNQGRIALWNLGQLANSLVPVLGETLPLQEIMDESVKSYGDKYLAMMAQKLGFKGLDPSMDTPIITGALQLLGERETDYTLFFRGLSGFNTGKKRDPGLLPSFIGQALYTSELPDDNYLAKVHSWLTIYNRRLELDGLSIKDRQAAMKLVNPKYVLRNYLAQQAIEKAETQDFSGIWELLDLVRRPYDNQPGKEEFAKKRPEWARHKPGCSMLSCSS